MKGLELEVAKRTLQGIFNEYKQLAVPLFQRPYSWDKEHWSQLWEDLSSHFQSDYLIGGIVLCGSENGEQIIDGQQRLTTLTVFAAACRNFSSNLRGDDAVRITDAFHNNIVAFTKLLSADSTPYLKLGGENFEWFQSKIQLHPKHPRFQLPGERINRGIGSSNRLLWRCYLYFTEQLTLRLEKLPLEAQLEQLKTIHELLLERLWFVVTRVPSADAAFTLFEVLNDRGLDLTVADLIKNVVLAEGEKHRCQADAQQIWTRITDLLEHQNISSFLRYMWMSENGKKITESELFSTLKDELKSISREKFLSKLNQLVTEAENYSQLIDADKDEIAHSATYEELKLIREYGFRTLNTALLAAWKVTKTGDPVREAVAKMLRVFLIRYSVISGKTTNTLESFLASMAKKLRDAGRCDLDGMRKALQNECPPEENIWRSFQEDLEPTANVARLLLTEIEYCLSGNDEKVRDTKSVNVEHIFPKSADSNWVESFQAGSEYEDYRNQLGNLTLLSGKRNRSASNKPYADKLKFYAGSKFKITTDIAKWSTWTAKAVQERQKDLMMVARKVWAL